MTDKIRKSNIQNAHSFGESWVRPSFVNEEKSPGTYEVEFNSIGLPSGMYFYTLKAGSPSTGSGQVFSETKEMILLK